MGATMGISMGPGAKKPKDPKGPKGPGRIRDSTSPKWPLGAQTKQMRAEKNVQNPRLQNSKWSHEVQVRAQHHVEPLDFRILSDGVRTQSILDV